MRVQAESWETGDSRRKEPKSGVEDSKQDVGVEGRINQQPWATHVIRDAVVLSFLMALALEAYIIYSAESDNNYAFIYLVPGSYTNYLEGNTVKFTYGVMQVGAPSSRFVLDIYIGDAKVSSRDLKDKAAVNDVVLKVPEGVSLPTKVRLVLNTDYGTNDVQFWILSKAREDSNAE